MPQGFWGHKRHPSVCPARSLQGLAFRAGRHAVRKPGGRVGTSDIVTG